MSILFFNKFFKSHKRTASEADFKALTKLDALHSLKKELNKLLLTAPSAESIVRDLPFFRVLC